ncbi:MAG: hypothetical protein ACLRXQ_09510 [Phascolarctobacterium faecium]
MPAGKGKTKVSEDLRPKNARGYAFHDMLVTRTASTRQELDVRGRRSKKRYRP